MPDQTRRLLALHRATLAISGELEVAPLLRKIVRTGAALVGARYGALGIPDGRGGFGTFIYVGINERQSKRIGSLPHAHGILGALVQEDRVIRVRDIRRDARFRHYPEHHPLMREFLGVPIRHGGRILGNLFYSGAAQGDFSSADERVAEMLAAHAAVAIVTAHRYAEAAAAARAERERIADELREAVLRALAVPSAGGPRHGDRALSRREREVLALLVDGAANKESAALTPELRARRRINRGDSRSGRAP